jgi:DNA polymerase-4
MAMIALLLRDFAIHLERQQHPPLADVPLMLVDDAYRPRVVAGDAQSRQAGVKAGMFLREVQALCPHAHIQHADESRYQRIFQDITQDLLQYTPRIEPEYQPTSAVWYTDDAPALTHIRAHLENVSDIAPQIGCASTKFVARVASALASTEKECCIPQGEEIHFLAPLPVAWLPLDKDMARRLPLLGIESMGQLAELPRIAVWEQFGKRGRWVHALASGDDIRPLQPHTPATSLRACHTLEDSIQDRFVLQNILEILAVRLAEQLQGQHTQHLMLLLMQEDSVIWERHHQPPQPISDGLTLLRHLKQLLEQLLIQYPITQPIQHIEVRLQNIQHRAPRQMGLFDTPATVHRLQDYLPDLAHRYQQARFYRLSLEEDALPEARTHKQHIPSKVQVG